MEGKSSRDEFLQQISELQTHVRVLSQALTLALQDYQHIDEFLNQLALLIRAEMHYDQFGIGLVDADDRMVYRAGYGLPDEWKGQQSLARGEGIVGWVFEHGQPLLVPDVRQDKRYFNARRSTRSEVCVPFCIRGQVLGVINAESDRPSAFTLRDVELLTALCNAVALTLHELMRREVALLLWQALTERERAVLRKLAQGKDDHQIARDLNIGQNTLRTHLRNIFQKLRVSSRAEAIVWVYKHKLWTDL